MYTNNAKALVDPAPIEPKYSHKRLPELIEYHARNPHKRLSDEYFTLLCNWMRKLEENYYKTQQYKSDAKYDVRVDRVLMFVQYTRENAHRDGAFLMYQWRWVFSNLEILLMCQRMRIAIAEDRHTVISKLRCPDVEYFKQLLSIENALDRDGKQFTLENAIHEWKQYRTKTLHKEPGKRATETFTRKYEHYRQVFDQRRLLEHGWATRGSDSSCTIQTDLLAG